MSDQWYHKYHEKYHKVIVAECVWFFLTTLVYLIQGGDGITVLGGKFLYNC